MRNQGISGTVAAVVVVAVIALAGLGAYIFMPGINPMSSTTPTSSRGSDTHTSSSTSSSSTTQTGVASSTSPVTCTASSSATSDVAVSMVDFSFNPSSVSITAGQSVQWTNDGSSIHTVTSTGGAFDSGSMSSGAKFTCTFHSAGVYNYECIFHAASNSMTGTVHVNPAY